ncbi:MAG: hypothetical protein KJ697_03365 [Nanoarchaeota archaeon]|nr:hypothetical protein [Nanoarchaeota archaeon]
MVLSNYDRNDEIRMCDISNITKNLYSEIKKEHGKGIIKLTTMSFGVPRRTVSNWINGTSPIPISKFFQLINIWKGVCRKSEDEKNKIIESAFKENEYFSVAKGKIVKLPKEITEELSYIIGYIIGDGCLVDIWKPKMRTGNFKYMIEIASDTVKFANKFNKFINNQFDLKANIYKTNSKCFEIYIQSKVLFIFLNKICGIPMGKKKGQLKIPDIIYNGSKEIKNAFIAGFFDADGCIYEPDKKIIFAQADRMFLEELKLFTERLNMQSGKISTRVKEFGITYDFSLKVDSIPTFLNNTPLQHPNRIKRANNMRAIVGVSRC